MPDNTCLLNICKGIRTGQCPCLLPPDPHCLPALDQALLAGGWSRVESRDGTATHLHRIHIALAGCPNACSRPQIADLGLIRACAPILDCSLCLGCGQCVDACPDQALHMEEGLPAFRSNRCLGCGPLRQGLSPWRSGPGEPGIPGSPGGQAGTPAPSGRGVAGAAPGGRGSGHRTVLPGAVRLRPRPRPTAGGSAGRRARPPEPPRFSRHEQTAAGSAFPLLPAAGRLRPAPGRRMAGRGMDSRPGHGLERPGLDAPRRCCGTRPGPVPVARRRCRPCGRAPGDGGAWLRLASIMGAAALCSGASALLLLTGRAQRLFPKGRDQGIPQAAAFALTVGVLVLVRAGSPVPVLLADRFAPGSGWLEILLLAAYAAWILGLMLDPARVPRCVPACGRCSPWPSSASWPWGFWGRTRPS